MMKKALIILFTLELTCIFCLAGSDSQDIEIKLPEKLMPKPTEEENIRLQKDRERNQVVLQACKDLPYRRPDEFDCVFYSFGQLVKLSDTILIVKVVDVEKIEPKSIADRFQPKLQLKVDVTSNLVGTFEQTDVLPVIRWWDRNGIPQKGDKLLVFIASEEYPSGMIDALKWNFDKTKIRGKVLDKPVVMGESRGVINLVDKTTEEEILKAVTGYMQNLRQRNWDVEKYYIFLRQLSASPNKRIKDDARSDMFLFLRFNPPVDLKRILEDKDVDDGIKSYVRFIMQPQVKP